MPALPPPLVDLERRLGLPAGSLDSTERARAEDALSDAAELALAEVSEDTAASWRVSAPAVVSLIVLKAARREYENPRGFTQTGAADTSATVLIASGAYLTAPEVAQIRRAAGSPARFVGSVRTPSAYE